MIVCVNFLKHVRVSCLSGESSKGLVMQSLGVIGSVHLHIIPASFKVQKSYVETG